MGQRVPIEEIVWDAPISQIDHELLIVKILTSEIPVEIKSIPGAAAPRRGGLRD
jgi:hypothetical protein